MSRMEDRDEVIEEAAEFSLTDEGAYYYARDLQHRYGLTAEEVDRVLERATDLRIERRMGWY